jgi:hypothetical protein
MKPKFLLFCCLSLLFLAGCESDPVYTDVIRAHQDGEVFDLHNHTFQLASSQLSLTLYLSGIQDISSFHVNVLEDNKGFVQVGDILEKEPDSPDLVKVTITIKENRDTKSRKAKFRAIGDGAGFSFIKADFTIRQDGI